MLNNRELATVLAALRAWQNIQQHEVPDAEMWQIASNAGAFAPLDDGEVDRLCERLNCAPTPIVVIVSGGQVQEVQNVPPGISVEIRDYDIASDDLYADTELPRDAQGDEYSSAIYTAEG